MYIEGSASSCSEECKFCALHKYGVLVLNLGGLLILISVLIVYWREFWDRWQSGLNRQVPDTQGDISTKDTITAQTEQSVNLGQNSVITQPLILPIFTQQQQLQQPPQQPQDKQKGQKAIKQVDPFKLPGPTLDNNSLEVHESTGSKYYKKMMRGKRPVASISEYVIGRKKKTKKHGHETNAKKHAIKEHPIKIIVKKA